MLSETEKREAYLEAQHILRLDKTWQELMPGERKPNFKRAAREILQRALGKKVIRNQAPLNIHGGLMHEHGPREAALIERTLKTGMYDPEVLHSFQLGSKESRAPPPTPVREIPPPEQHFEVFLHDHGATEHHPSYFEPGTGDYHSSMTEEPDAQELPLTVPKAARLPSDYEAVH